MASGHGAAVVWWPQGICRRCDVERGWHWEKTSMMLLSLNKNALLRAVIYPIFLHARSTWYWMKVRRMVFEPLKWRWPKTGVVWDLEIWIGTTCSAFLTRCVIYVCEDLVYVDIVLNQRACSYVAYACIRMYYRHKCEETVNQWYRSSWHQGDSGFRNLFQ